MRLLITLWACVMIIGVGHLAAQTREGSDYTIDKTVPGVFRRIQIESPDPQIKSLLQKAFGLHGAFEVRTAGQVHFVFTFTPAGGNRVTLAISSGGQPLLEQSFTGRTLQAAALQAADHAVQRTVDLPGFFSGSVAFISNQTGSPEVYLSDLLFTEVRRLTRDNGQALLPDLHPDGRSLLYTSYHRNGFPDIYRIDLTNNQRTIFASFRGLNTGATYSRDGSSVAMILSGSGNSELYVSNPSGEQLRRLTRTSGLEADPSWSPSGDRLAFTSDDLGKPQIFVINADGSNRRRVPTNISGNCSEPAWNPRNADQIAFTAAIGREFEVCLYDFSERESRQLTRGLGDAVEPVWLSDGRHLIYTERTPRTSRLVLFDSLSGKKSYLTAQGMGRCSMGDYIGG